jgi:hypothetical protein
LEFLVQIYLVHRAIFGDEIPYSEEVGAIAGMSNQEPMVLTLLQATAELVQSTGEQKENINILIDQVGRLLELLP